MSARERLGAASTGHRLWSIRYLDNLTGGCRRHIPSIRRSAGFDEKNMGLVLSDRPVLNALRHHEYFAWTKPYSAVSQLNSDMSNENQKEVVGIVVLVPNEFALDLHDHEVVTVEATDDARLPIFRECREFIREIYCAHGFHDFLVSNAAVMTSNLSNNYFFATPVRKRQVGDVEGSPTAGDR
jgi:hypothetical protein